MSTVERDASAAWFALRDVWPDIAWASSPYRHGAFHTPGLIDFDNACVADPAIDIAPLIGFYGAANVGSVVDADVLAWAQILRASLPLQVAAAAALRGDLALQDHALSNFTRRLEEGSLFDSAAAV